MGIVLDECEWAKNAITTKDMGKKPLETLTRVAKYYYSCGYDEENVLRLLELFVAQCNPNTPIIRWEDTLDRVVKFAPKYSIIKIDKVDVSESELEVIDKLKGRQLKRLAFALLCVAKYWDLMSSSNNHWVNSDDREIMQMANINTSIRRQSEMYAELRRLGLIKFSKKVDNLNVQVLFTDNDSPTAMEIRDYRNLGYQYLRRCGYPYFVCANCGITVKCNNPNKGRKQKYCPSCANELHTRQKVDAVMRKRDMSKK